MYSTLADTSTCKPGPAAETPVHQSIGYEKMRVVVECVWIVPERSSMHLSLDSEILEYRFHHQIAFGQIRKIGVQRETVQQRFALGRGRHATTSYRRCEDPLHVALGACQRRQSAVDEDHLESPRHEKGGSNA